MQFFIRKFRGNPVKKFHRFNSDNQQYRKKSRFKNSIINNDEYLLLEYYYLKGDLNFHFRS